MAVGPLDARIAIVFRTEISRSLGAPSARIQWPSCIPKSGGMAVAGSAGACREGRRQRPRSNSLRTTPAPRPNGGVAELSRRGSRGAVTPTFRHGDLCPMSKQVPGSRSSTRRPGFFEAQTQARWSAPQESTVVECIRPGGALNRSGAFGPRKKTWRVGVRDRDGLSLTGMLGCPTRPI